MSTKFLKIAPVDTEIDTRYQRALDEARARKMAESFRPDLIGVPVVSKRSNGALVRIDGQHRIQAAILAGRGNESIMMEVHEGLDVREEAELFLRLNGGRTAVGAYDKYKARLVAREPSALEIERTLKLAGVKIVRSPCRNGIMAIRSVEHVHFLGNLAKTVEVLVKWGDGEVEFLDGVLVRAIGDFLAEYPDADTREIVLKLQKFDPLKIIGKIRRTKGGFELSSRDAAVVVLRELYNERRGARSRLPPPKRNHSALDEAEAAE